MNFKKITAIASSILLAGMTMGVAAAANYPAPFVEDSAVDVAIVYGTGTGVSSLDEAEATLIKGDLAAELEGDVTIVSGGEVLALGGDDDEFYFGNALNSVYDDDLDKKDLEDFLADGEYDDGDIEEDYSQIITLGVQELELFADRDWDDETPTLGFHFNSDEVLSYTITFDDAIDYSDTEGTEMPLMGSEYYVLDATDEDELILLDSAEKTIIYEGEELEVDGKTVKISAIEETYVKFIVDGELTDKLYEDPADGDKYYELKDGSYLVLNENLFASKETSSSSAEFSIGSGKITLFADGSEIEVNDDPIDGLTSEYTVITGEFEEIKITWETDGEEFLVKGNSLVMPVFESIGLVFDGLDFPSDPETIALEKGEEFTISMGNFDIEILFSEDGETVTQGADGNPLIIDATEADSKTYFVIKDDRILATYLNEDLNKVEMAYYEVSSMDESSGDLDLNLQNLIDTNDDVVFTDADAGDDEDLTSDITVTLDAVYEDGTVYDNATMLDMKDIGYWNDTTPVNGSSTLEYDVANITVSHDDAEDLHFDKVVSELGLIIEIPEDANMSANTLTVNFYEADEDGDLDYDVSGTPIAIDLAWEDDDDVIYATKDGVDFQEESEDNFYGYVESALATKVTADTNDDSLELEYYGDKVPADIQIVVGGDVSTEGAAIGDIVVKDTEAASMTDTNLIVVGGSCINSIAADLLGGALCGAAFTEATNVAAGQYMIKSYDWGDDKIALLVAGYHVEDTQAAGQYLRTQTVNTATADMVGPM